MSEQQTTPGADVSTPAEGATTTNTTPAPADVKAAAAGPDAVTASTADGRPVAGTPAEVKPAAKPAADKPADTGADDTSKPGQAPAGTEKVDDLPSWAQKIIKEARQGEGDYRKRAQSAEAEKKSTEDKLQSFLDGFAKVLGLSADEVDGKAEPADPEKLTAELASAQKEHRATQVELAVYRAAPEYAGDPDALLDSRSFLNKVLTFDPAAGDFGQQVAAAIKEAVASNPKLKAPAPAAAAPASPSGGEFAGGPSGRTDAESLSVDDFRKRRHGVVGRT